MKNALLIAFVCLLCLPTWVQARQKSVLTGVVLDETRRPIEGVKVAVGSSQFVETDRLGKFVIETDAAKKAVNTIVAEKDGFEQHGFKYLTETKIEIVMHHLPMIYGKVLDKENIPVAMIEVRIETPSFKESDWTDANGAFRLKLKENKPVGKEAKFFVGNKPVVATDIMFSDAYNVTLLNQNATGQKPEKDQSFKVTVYQADGTVGKNLPVFIEDVEYITDGQGEFVVNGSQEKPNDIKIKGFQVTSSNYDNVHNHLIIRIETQQEGDVDVPIDVNFNANDSLVAEYKEDFNIVLRQLEIRKQNLSENSLRIKTEMEEIAERLNIDGQQLNDNNREELTHDLLILEQELIENELAYETAQEETKKIIDQMKYTLRAKDHKIEEIESEMKAEEIAAAIAIVVLLVLFIGAYRLATRMKKQRDELEKAYKNIQTISDIGKEITATLDFETLVQTVHASVDSLIDATIFGVGITNPALNKIEFKSYIEQGETQSYFYESLDDKNKFSVWCLRNRKEVVINDIKTEYTRYIPANMFRPTDDMPQSLVYLPLIIENEAIGVITVQSFRKNAYKAIDTTILQTLASYVSIALDNSNAYSVIKDKNKSITNSICYAQTIQQAILPSHILLDQYLDDHFIIYRPKDIVSGDFYWFSHVEQGDGKKLLFLAAVDCTGHGVPGAFMSMIGNTLLDEIVEQNEIYNTAEILDRLNDAVQEALKQESKVNDDGMDICLCRIEQVSPGKYEVMFTGAKRPLYCYRKSEGTMSVLRGDTKSIGGIQRKRRSFTSEVLSLEAGDSIFLTSDGLVDQCDASKEKFGTQRFVDMLRGAANLHMSEQERLIEQALDKHQGTTEQRDDILVMGVRFK